MNKNRRHFLKAGLAAVGAVTLNPYIVTSAQETKKPAPSDRLRLGMIACGDMACRNARDFDEFVDFAAMCDVNSDQLAYAMKDPKIGKAGTADERKIDTYKEYQRILERKDIDAVSIATPDHWHVKQAVEALQAGKHVFCEKPLTLTLEENQIIRKACEKYGKKFQVGTRMRSDRADAVEFVAMARKGLIGEVKKATVCVGGGPKSPELPVVDVPEILNYEKWIGPAPMVPYRASEARMDFRERKAVWPRQSNVFYNFRWWLDYSGGKLTDIGAHQVDMCLWALNRNGAGMGPVKIIPHEIEMPAKMENGYPVETDRYNTPSQFRIECVYEDGFVMEVVSKSPDGAGVLLEGTKGRLHYNGGRIKGKPYEIDKVQEVLTAEDFRKIRKGKEWMSHKANFIACIKEGGEPVSDVASHVQAMSVCHLAVIAARLNREISWDPKAEKFGDEQAQQFFARQERKGYEIPRE